MKMKYQTNFITGQRPGHSRNQPQSVLFVSCGYQGPGNQSDNFWSLISKLCFIYLRFPFSLVPVFEAYIYINLFILLPLLFLTKFAVLYTLKLGRYGFVLGFKPFGLLLHQPQTSLHSVVGIESVKKQSDDDYAEQYLDARSSPP